MGSLDDKLSGPLGLLPLSLVEVYGEFLLVQGM